ncbi:hypothetical protein J1N35_027358 [Gossypium stocksii]|uniref:NADH dehydrogenase [ubiquinone] 1 beta subcomplex subunit 8, mitochondrial n=1 Tax=Gossypium stocksii TaxID=47602 RepID=A0A9D3ZXW9_9ROSI|nr:hypothetical protein J1N35_027358 [Gossypium stocksii]
MAGRLSNVASKIMGGNGIVSRSAASSLRLRSGMGLPVGKHIVPDKPLPVNDELMWDNGTAFPEPCIDRIADTVGKYEALGWMCGGLSFFASLGFLAWWNDKASKIPFTIQDSSLFSTIFYSSKNFAQVYDLRSMSLVLLASFSNEPLPLEWRLLLAVCLHQMLTKLTMYFGVCKKTLVG